MIELFFGVPTDPMLFLSDYVKSSVVFMFLEIFFYVIAEEEGRGGLPPGRSVVEPLLKNLLSIYSG